MILSPHVGTIVTPPHPSQDTVSWTDNIASSGYSSTSLPLRPGNYTLYHIKDDEKFVGYVYGHSEDTNPAGYGYATGYDSK